MTNLRKVSFKKWIPGVYEMPASSISGSSKLKPGTQCWEAEFCNTGLFHQWAVTYEETSAGFANYTVGLIELFDGTIESVLPSQIKFLDQ